jgi:hypothetical protein
MRAHLGTRPPRPAVPGQDSALAGWLVAHGLRYGLGQSPSNVVTVDSKARVEVVPVAVRWGRVGSARYQSSAGAYDPRLHDAFLVGRPARRVVARVGLDAALPRRAGDVRAAGPELSIRRVRGACVECEPAHPNGRIAR